MFLCSHPCHSSVSVSIILNYTLQRFCVRLYDGLSMQKNILITAKVSSCRAVFFTALFFIPVIKTIVKTHVFLIIHFIVNYNNSIMNTEWIVYNTFKKKKFTSFLLILRHQNFVRKLR